MDRPPQSPRPFEPRFDGRSSHACDASGGQDVGQFVSSLSRPGQLTVVVQRQSQRPLQRRLHNGPGALAQVAIAPSIRIAFDPVRIQKLVGAGLAVDSVHVIYRRKAASKTTNRIHSRSLPSHQQRSPCPSRSPFPYRQEGRDLRTSGASVISRKRMLLAPAV